MIYAVLNRLVDNDEAQTLGHFILYDGVDILFECRTLELPDLGNQRRISRIPEGTYQAKERYSAKHLYHYHIQDVEGRSLILIHVGNRKDQIEGCILVGNFFQDIDGDGHLDVVNSRMTFNKLMSKAGRGFRITINDIDCGA